MRIYNDVFIYPNHINSTQNILCTPKKYAIPFSNNTEISSNFDYAIKSAVIPSINFKSTTNTKSANDINKILTTEYGIKSTLTNPDVAKLFLASVEDFVKLNNKNMFEGLILSDLTDDNNIYKYKHSINTNSFEISFQKNLNENDIIKKTQNSYEKNFIATNDKKYLFYKSLGSFLCFKENPFSYNYKTQRRAIGGDKLIASRKLGIHATENYSEYNANYIAAKMCKLPTTQKMDDIYEDLIGADINFPKPNNTEIKGTEFSFQSVQEAQDYLKQYNIKAKFYDTNMANLTVSAIEDFIKANGKNIFDGLEITYISDKESWDGATYRDFDDVKNKIIKSYIVLNIACNWKKTDKLSQKEYQCNYSSSNNPKSTIYHELAHWLHFHNNPLKYYIQTKKYSNTYNNKNNTKLLTEYEKNIFGRVSDYATSSPLEFVAEYISARMSGYSFPETINNKFKTIYGKGNIPLKFPNPKISK